MSSNKEQIKNIKKIKLLKDHSSKYSLGTVSVDGKVELNKAGQNLLKKASYEPL